MTPPAKGATRACPHFTIRRTKLCHLIRPSCVTLIKIFLIGLDKPQFCDIMKPVPCFALFRRCTTPSLYAPARGLYIQNEFTASLKIRAFIPLTNQRKGV